MFAKQKLVFNYISTNYVNFLCFLSCTEKSGLKKPAVKRFSWFLTSFRHFPKWKIAVKKCRVMTVILCLSIQKLESIYTHPWAVYRNKTANVIGCFLHNQWFEGIDTAGTSLCRIITRHFDGRRNPGRHGNVPTLRIPLYAAPACNGRIEKPPFCLYLRFFVDSCEA